ncbi:hypothetical protein M885DRAFT_505771 [Pelagophyceae sp. CCMP2097]|nr:hypothetical protein M885DRAFT_505771 [Pelagophyceae sp. CCMP2097]
MAEFGAAKASTENQDKFKSFCATATFTTDDARKHVQEALRRRVDETKEDALVRVRQRQPVYDVVFQQWLSTHGKHVSKREREALGMHTSSLIYGEINYESFGRTIEKIRTVYGLPGVGASDAKGIMQQPGTGVFYDLGSGAGKPTIAAATLFRFERALGLEFLPGLVSASHAARERWAEVAHDMLRLIDPAEFSGLARTAVEFHRGDITDLVAHDWTIGDVVFANSTCFDDVLLAALAREASRMRKGTFFITFTKRLPSPHFETCEAELHQMSWGGATVYIQQKMTESCQPTGDQPSPVAEAWAKQAKEAVVDVEADADRTPVPGCFSPLQALLGRLDLRLGPQLKEPS